MGHEPFTHMGKIIDLNLITGLSANVFAWVSYFSGGTTMRMICKVLLKESEEGKKQKRQSQHHSFWGNGGLSDIIMF